MIPNRFEYLKACDILIARAGHGTITHGICYGKPMILVPTPSHTEQLNNSERVAELGIAEVLDQNDLNKKLLITTIEKMLSEDQYPKRAGEIQEAISNLNGLETAVETITNVAENIKVMN